MRQATVSRQTNETQIEIKLNIDGNGHFTGKSGVGFFDHMLNAFSVHSGFDIELNAHGDLDVDCHHTIEDIGIVLGRALAKVLGDKQGICRFGQACIPMDEALARAVVDISGRPYLVFNATFNEEKIGTFDTCMAKEFMRAFAFNAGITLHLELLYGENSHHCVEVLFKAFAHALKKAAEINENGDISSKGLLI